MRIEARAAGSEGSKPSRAPGRGPRMAERRPERPLEHQSSEPVRVALGASSVSFQVSRLPDRAAQTCGQGVTHRRQGGAVQRAAEEVGMAAFDAICLLRAERSSTRRLGPYLTLPYLTLPSEGADVAAIWCTPFVAALSQAVHVPLTSLWRR